MKTRLISYIQSIQDPALRQTCETILGYDKFFTCPASLGFHHAYEGGLLAHTVEACDTAKQLAGYDENPERCFNRAVNFDILIASALFHDLLKMDEYCFFWDWPANTVGQRLVRVPGTDESGLQKFWGHTDTRYLQNIGHICGSAAQFQVTAVNHGVSRATIDAVTHCILAHHGRKEWGSPVEPQTLEALILSQADLLSAKFGATKDKQP